MQERPSSPLNVKLASLSRLQAAGALAEKVDRTLFRLLVGSNVAVERAAASVLYLRSLDPPARVDVSTVELCTAMLQIFVDIRSRHLDVEVAGAERVQKAMAALLRRKVIAVAPKLAAHTLLLDGRLRLCGTWTRGSSRTTSLLSSRRPNSAMQQDTVIFDQDARVCTPLSLTHPHRH